MSFLGGILAMKKILSVICLTGIMCVNTFASGIAVYVNNNKVNFSQPPVVENGATLVPVRGLLEKIGATVDWDKETKTVTSTLGASTVKMVIGSKTAYVDNKIVLRITRGGENVLNKTFTKNDFSSVVDANFLSKSVLEGIVYDKTTPEGIVYAASVCYPQTDLYVPLSITVSADGKMSIKKVDMLEEDYPEETAD